jgi:hypothetical protein
MSAYHVLDPLITGGVGSTGISLLSTQTEAYPALLYIQGFTPVVLFLLSQAVLSTLTEPSHGQAKTLLYHLP